eukprot:CAMPEP_0114504924 /NCGR_PEP_ID=MMETSP0109-20121206/10554_1 /TAXON_ID=29199 /ORGANISM="Chlorarachnion reptans, Strain CCCM449" /LENGTH=331 /DNA_ID=CAMNT_0001683279 /DNA_START=17 /DNA_END=1012 /DNA_ORIENTATION=+
MKRTNKNLACFLDSFDIIKKPRRELYEILRLLRMEPVPRALDGLEAIRREQRLDGIHVLWIPGLDIVRVPASREQRRPCVDISSVEEGGEVVPLVQALLQHCEVALPPPLAGTAVQIHQREPPDGLARDPRLQPLHGVAPRRDLREVEQRERGDDPSERGARVGALALGVLDRRDVGCDQRGHPFGVMESRHHRDAASKGVPEHDGRVQPEVVEEADEVAGHRRGRHRVGVGARPVVAEVDPNDRPIARDPRREGELAHVRCGAEQAVEDDHRRPAAARHRRPRLEVLPARRDAVRELDVRGGGGERGPGLRHRCPRRRRRRRRRRRGGAA